MRENITVYSISGTVNPSPTASIGMDPSTVVSDPISAPYSSSQHEVTRLNGLDVGLEINDARDFSSPVWESLSGRGTSVTSSEYGNQVMEVPYSERKQYYAKTYTTGAEEQRFRRYIYVVNATTSGTIPGASGSYITPASGAAESTYDSRYGRLIDAHQNDTFKINIPVSKRGKIRDVKVWVELVHRDRSGNVDSGLKGLQIALVSPNVKFPGAYPLWNMPGASSFEYDHNPNVSGTDGLMNGTFSRRIPEIFTSGAYVLWDGHSASPALKYAVENLGLQGDWHEFDSDIDIRTIFTDSSLNQNPRSRISVFPSATEISPGIAADLSATLIYGLKPLSYYWSPSNFAQRFHSGAFSWGGPSASLSGAVVPWFVDPNLTPGLMNETVVGTPPDGWVTGDPNGLLYPWNTTATAESSASLVAIVEGSATASLTTGATSVNVYQDQTSWMGQDPVAVEGTFFTGDTILIRDNLTASLSHTAVITGMTLNSYFDGIVSSTESFGNLRFPLSNSGNLSAAPTDLTLQRNWNPQFLGYLQLNISPGLPAGLHKQSRVYNLNGIRYTTGSAIDSGRTWYPGYTLERHYVTDTSYKRLFNFGRLIAPSVSGSTIPSSGTYIHAFGRVLHVAQAWRSVYISNNAIGSKDYLEGPYDMISIIYPGDSRGLLSDRELSLISGSSIKIATPVTATVGLESALTTFGLGNRWGFSYKFKPPNQVLLIGGYTGTLDAPVSANFVDTLYFSGSSIVTASRSGTISDAAGDGGAKAIRTHGGLFIVNPYPHSATFLVLVGGGQTGTLAITSSGLDTYSTASTVASTWSAPYSYKYWTAAEYYENE